MVCWCPDSARIKKKMVYAASFDSLKKSFTGVQKIINANGFDEVEQAYIEDILKSSSRTWAANQDHDPDPNFQTNFSKGL